MSLFSSLFGRAKGSLEGALGIEQHLDYLDSLRIPAIALAASADDVLSKIGGLPSLPYDVSWPESNGEPLAFLCQLALDEIPDDCRRHGLPQSGLLYFFYDQQQQTWGFDPKDKGSWRVIYADAPLQNEPLSDAPDGLEEDSIYAEKPIVFKSIQSYPDGQDARVAALDLSDKQGDEYCELRSSAFGGGPAHQLFGYPSPVQGNDMDLECQFVSHGLYCGNSSGYQDPRARSLEAGRHDWMLLLQLDTDDDAGMMWGDAGMLYFWIRKQDLQAGHFDNCWMILQCY